MLKTDSYQTAIKKERVTLKTRNSSKHVRLIYILCKDKNGQIFEDGSFQGPPHEDTSITSAIQRISVGALMAQYFYSQTLPANKSFQLELDKYNEPKVHVLVLQESNEDVWQLSQDDLWALVGKEILLSTLAKPYTKYLAFTSFTRYEFKSKKRPEYLVHNDYVKMTKGLVSLGGGGLALLSTHCLYTWPTSVGDIVTKLCDETAVDVKKCMDDSSNR